MFNRLFLPTLCLAILTGCLDGPRLGEDAPPALPAAMVTYDLADDEFYLGAQRVRLSSTTAGATIRYTVTPDGGGAPITGSIASGATIVIDDFVEITAVATAVGYSESAPASRSYKVYGRVLEVRDVTVGASTVPPDNVSVTNTRLIDVPQGTHVRGRNLRIVLESYISPCDPRFGRGGVTLVLQDTGGGETRIDTGCSLRSGAALIVYKPELGVLEYASRIGRGPDFQEFRQEGLPDDLVLVGIELTAQAVYSFFTAPISSASTSVRVGGLDIFQYSGEVHQPIAFGMEPSARIVFDPAFAGEPVVLTADVVDDSPMSLEYRWDLDGDQQFDTDFAAASSIEHTFPTSGETNVFLQVRDNKDDYIVNTFRTVRVFDRLPSGDLILETFDDAAGWTGLDGEHAFLVNGSLIVQRLGSSMRSEHTVSKTLSAGSGNAVLEDVSISMRYRDLVVTPYPWGFGIRLGVANLSLIQIFEKLPQPSGELTYQISGLGQTLEVDARVDGQPVEGYIVNARFCRACDGSFEVYVFDPDLTRSHSIAIEELRVTLP